MDIEFKRLIIKNKLIILNYFFIYNKKYHNIRLKRTKIRNRSKKDCMTEKQRKNIFPNVNLTNGK